MSRESPAGVAAQWNAHLEKWKSSGLSLRAFAEREKLKINSLWYWKRRLLGTKSRPTVTLVPVVVAPTKAEPENKPLYELILRSGHTLRVPADFDDQTLRRLIATLGGG
jgi:hypothetical protein